MKSIQDIIKNRRSVFPRMFSGENVAHEKIELLLEAANWAPTHKLTEPWRFTVFTGNGLSSLAEFQSELYKKVATEKGLFDQFLYEKLGKNPKKCSHVISIGVRVGGKVPEIEETNAVAAAVQNMQLVASENGIGCYWGTGGITYYDEAKSFFDLAAQDKLMGFLYVGSFDGGNSDGKRKDIGDKVKWVR